jgi:hypothetical protein
MAYAQRLKLLELVSQRAYLLREGCITRDTPLPEMMRCGLRKERSANAPPGLLPIALSVELALYSAYVKDSRPLSLLIIAPVGSGKTELLHSYSENKGVVLYNDFTAYGLYTLLGQIQAGLVKHVLVADLVRLTSRGPSVWRQILTTLDALIEEGVTRIDTFFVKFHSPTPVRAGIVAALTTDEWRARRKTWIKYGFLSRAIPISYELAPEDLLKGEEAIYEGKSLFQPVKLKLPEAQVEVGLSEHIKEQLKRLGRIIAAVNQDETRFRSHKHVLAMAKASALRSGRMEVNEEDVNTLRALSVLWLSPYSGDEPSFRIMLELPKTSSQLIDALSPFYSKATVYRRLQKLSQLRAIKQEHGTWYSNL